jgi:hypothetical protein
MVVCITHLSALIHYPLAFEAGHGVLQHLVGPEGQYRTASYPGSLGLTAVEADPKTVLLELRPVTVLLDHGEA